MIKDIDDGGVAFPDNVQQDGMSLRDYFAAIAMGPNAGLHDEEMKTFAERAYAMADAMIEARKR